MSNRRVYRKHPKISQGIIDQCLDPMSGKYFCINEGCNSNYVTTQALIQHMRNDCGRLFVCKCRKTFKYKRNLLCHIRLIHRDFKDEYMTAWMEL